jgi:hypothetical protein
VIKESSVDMASKSNPPILSAEKPWERYKLELQAWQKLTKLDKKQQGLSVALHGLPEDHTSGIRDKVFDEFGIDKLGAEDGMKELIKFMDEKLGKDELTDSFDKFVDFENYARENSLSVTEYISKFDQKYKRIEKLGMKLPSSILAFKLLEGSKIKAEERMLVLTAMDYSNKETLYEQAKKSLKKFKGEMAGASASASVEIKLEPAFLAQNEEALLAAGYVHRGFSGQ